MQERRRSQAKKIRKTDSHDHPHGPIHVSTPPSSQQPGKAKENRRSGLDEVYKSRSQIAKSQLRLLPGPAAEYLAPVQVPCTVDIPKRSPKMSKSSLASPPNSVQPSPMLSRLAQCKMR